MATAPERAPALASGDRLTRDEFHRRYLARPDIAKAELIGGVVYVPSPVRHTVHSAPHSLIVMWLGAYAAADPDLSVGDNGTVFLADDSEVQPDAFLLRSGAGAPASLGTDGYIHGAPELVVEIAASSAPVDLGDKKEAYRRAGVREYIGWRTLNGEIDWFRLEGGAYRPVLPDTHGIIESAVFLGLRLQVEALLAADAVAVLAAIGYRRDR